MEPMWMRLLNPALLLRNIMTPGPTDQRESAEFFTAREPYRRLSERDDVLVYQTEPLTEAVEVTGPIEVELWIASSAVDTDFTAKLVDVFPPNEDYPDGYDMMINDSIIRTRFREGFEREVLMKPGTPNAVRLRLPPTSNVFAGGHRIRVDVSSSNFPRLERNPNTGEPIGRHTKLVKADQTVFSDAGRLRDLTLDLVRVESPTGETRAAADLYAARLEKLGMEVEVQRDVFPATPIVIGRLRGARPGPTVALNGHLDTVP